MPRLALLDSSGIPHHEIIRGIELRRIFNDNRDRDAGKNGWDTDKG